MKTEFSQKALRDKARFLTTTPEAPAKPLLNNTEGLNPDEDDDLSPEDYELGLLALGAFGQPEASFAVANAAELTSERELGSKMKREKKD